MWTQPPYNDRNSLLFLIPPKLKQSQLLSHFNFGVNNQCSLPPSIPRPLRPLSKTPNPQLLPGCRSIGCPLLQMCVHGVCVFTAVCVCTWMGWMKSRNSEYGSPFLAKHHFTSTKLIYAWLRKSFYSRLFLNDWQFNAGFVKKLKLKDDHFHRRERRGEQWSLALKRDMHRHESLWTELFLTRQKVEEEEFFICHIHNYTEYNQQWNVFSAFNSSKINVSCQ